MTRFCADIFHVATYELGEAVRTRLFQLVLLGYSGGIALATWLLVKLLVNFEAGLAESMGVPATEKPGAMMNTLLQDESLLSMVAGFAGGNEVARALLAEPILGLWTGAVSMGLLPLVLLFSASGSIAAEVKSRSVRYLLCRTGRLQIGLGKLLGQLFIALVAALIGGALAWVLGMTWMVKNPPAELAISIVLRTGRAAIWALPFAGIGLAASQWIPSPNGARVVAGVLVAGMPISAAILADYAGTDAIGRVADLAGMFIATTSWTDYWSPDPVTFASAAVRSVVLAIVYYSFGHLAFSRKDL